MRVSRPRRWNVQGFHFVCGRCDHTIEAWDDGNPYYFESVITKTGEVKQKKKCVYHPNDELLERCIDNDTEHLCLSRKKEFMVDSEAPITASSKCKPSAIVDTMELAGKLCPYCKEGVFRRELDSIS